MEILAPAGSREALERAVAAGADAVYLGYSAFSARAGAGNFDEPALREALAFAHLHHVRVYVTVNTLIKDQELDRVAEVLRLLREVRADGVLVQDLGVLRLARQRFPGLRIHASTQMAIHHGTGVRWCAEMGMKRVVLARECSLEEIRRCVETGMEIEVFGHGAQCVSVSGECLFSSMVGDRSGNRGRCAQPCRKRYRFEGMEGAWLSPRDLCLRDQLPRLSETGASSLKIEGRLKRPEYVYTVTESYRRGMDSLKAGAFRRADEAEMEGLRQAFHRGGFMTGYAFGAEDEGVIAPERVNHQGVFLGTVTRIRGNLAQVLLEKLLHDGDGLRICHGTQEAEMTYTGRELPAGETATLRLREGIRAGKGDQVWRLTDSARQAAAMAVPIPKIIVDMALEAWPGKPLRLRLTDGESETEVVGEAVAPARTRAATAEELVRQLRKTGGTDFEARKVQARTEGAFVPVSALNELRRAGLERLAEARRERFAFAGSPEEMPRSSKDATCPPEEGAMSREAMPPVALPGLIAMVRTPAQAEVCREAGAMIIWYPEDFRPEALDALRGKLRQGEWLRLPEVCEEETLQALHRFAIRNQERLGGVLLGGVGQLGLRWPVPVAAGPGIPVMNREAARLLASQGCAFVMASPELTGEELRKLTAPETGMPPVATAVYGRTQLMLLHHCPARTALGWKQGHGTCGLCDAGDERSLRGKWLEDERGYRFPLQRIRLPEGCLARLLNALPTDLGDRRIPGPRVIELTEETPEDAAVIVSSVGAYEKAPGESTRGHWNRPVQ